MSDFRAFNFIQSIRNLISVHIIVSRKIGSAPLDGLVELLQFLSSPVLTEMLL